MPHKYNCIPEPLFLASRESTFEMTASPNSEQSYDSSYLQVFAQRQVQQRYRCSFEGCGKDYSTKGHLLRHRKSHSSVRPFSCEVPGCDRVFTRSDCQKAHIQTHRRKLKVELERFKQRSSLPECRDSNPTTEARFSPIIQAPSSIHHFRKQPIMSSSYAFPETTLGDDCNLTKHQQQQKTSISFLIN
ncbi:hypothetical protein BDR26DRAFT_851183 [Obelidium mucronatum]|nr:hypothetical protein BDR26DRAFT_851183 [Obelidium mucronatum]